MTVRDLGSFARGLGDALGAAKPVPRIREFLHEILTTEPAAWESEERQLVQRIAERLDATEEDEDRLVSLAWDIEALITESASPTEVAVLLEVIAERRRAVDVMEKYLNGPVSRTGYLSFVSEQRWPVSVRRRMADLSDEEIIDLKRALESPDIPQLLETLGH